MPSFSYTAVTKAGATTRGAIVARDEVGALDVLVRRGLTPTALRKGRWSNVPWWKRELFPRRRLSARLFPIFTSLATLLNARLPLIEALGFVAAQTRDPVLHHLLSNLQDALQNGQSLTHALDSPDATALPLRIRTLLQLGERTDTLAQTCARVASMLKSEADIAGELRSALVYPVILLAMSLLVLGMLVFFLTPTLLQVFVTAQADPPGLLSVMNAVRIAFVVHIGPLAAGVAIVALLAVLLRSRLSHALQWILSRTPITATFLRKRDSAAFCQTMSVMLQAGMSSVDGLSAATPIIRTPAWRQAITQARLDVEAGASLADALERLDQLDPIAKALIRAGDKSDRLGDMFQSAADTLHRDTQAALKRALSLLTPFLTLLIGGLVGVLIVSTITAILDLNDIAF